MWLLEVGVPDRAALLRVGFRRWPRAGRVLVGLFSGRSVPSRLRPRLLHRKFLVCPGPEADLLLSTAGGIEQRLLRDARHKLIEQLRRIFRHFLNILAPVPRVYSAFTPR